ncbi:MAG TPA: hypothetical protein VI968_02120 [archaeon]|nr:hypothetical protein [archaeon]
MNEAKSGSLNVVFSSAELREEGEYAIYNLQAYEAFVEKCERPELVRELYRGSITECCVYVLKHCGKKARLVSVNG